MIIEKIVDSVNMTGILFTILIFIGLVSYTPLIFRILSFTVKTLIGIYLVIKFSGKFNVSEKMSKFDRKICFLSGMYIIVFNLGDYIREAAYSVRPLLLPIIEKILPVKS
jgi:hypothetical protein